MSVRSDVRPAQTYQRSTTSRTGVHPRSCSRAMISPSVQAIPSFQSAWLEKYFPGRARLHRSTTSSQRRRSRPSATQRTRRLIAQGVVQHSRSLLLSRWKARPCRPIPSDVTATSQNGGERLRNDKPSRVTRATGRRAIRGETRARQLHGYAMWTGKPVRPMIGAAPTRTRPSSTPGPKRPDSLAPERGPARPHSQPPRPRPSK